MQFGKFEEKAMEFLKENNISNSIDSKGSLFTVHVLSAYKAKKLAFQTSNFMFEVTAGNLEELFDKAFRVLKSYGPKATRERNSGEEVECIVLEEKTTSKGEQE